MPFRYIQSTGELIAPDGRTLGFGYSGNGDGCNNPSLEMRPGVGPIPRGEWMMGPAYHHGALGPLTIRLQPYQHRAHGRRPFYMHGDNGQGNRSASHGSIVLSPQLRRVVDAGRDPVLVVE